MSLAAVIEKRVICMHGEWTMPLTQHRLTCPDTSRFLMFVCVPRCSGGIGKSISSVEQLEALTRPLTMETGGNVLMDLLWRCGLLASSCAMCAVTNLFASSDPTENDSITGLRPNARGPGLVTFGPDRVKEFCDANGLQACAAAICLRLTRRPDTHPADDYPSARMCDGRLRALRSRAAHHGILGNQLLWHGQQCGRHPGPRAGLGAFSHLSAQQPYLRISNASANAVPASRPSTVRAPPCAGHILAPG